MAKNLSVQVLSAHVLLVLSLSVAFDLFMRITVLFFFNHYLTYTYILSVTRLFEQLQDDLITDNCKFH